MNISTSLFSNVLHRSALLAVFAACGLMSYAEFDNTKQHVFVCDGIIYKEGAKSALTSNKKSQLTVQKTTVATTTGTEAKPTEYAGDLVIPEKVTFNGNEYTVVSIASAFKGCANLTSLKVEAKITDLARGAFQGCTSLTKVEVPNTVVKYNGDIFNGCTALTEHVVPGSVTGEISANQFKGCTALKKLVFADSETALDITSGAFVDAAVEGVEINRPLGTKYTSMTDKPFRSSAALTNVTIGGHCVELPSSFFENCKALSSVTFNSDVTTLGTNVFAGTALVDVVLPETVTAISASCFQGCKSLNSVTLGGAVTSIADMAFYNSSLKSINLPQTVTSIGQMAFSGANLSGALVLPESLTTVGKQAFASNTGLTEVTFGSAVKNIGEGAFALCSGIAKFTVDAANESYKSLADNSAVISADGTTLLLYAVAHPNTELTGDYTSIAANAANGAKNLTKINLPSCQNWGDYSVAGTSVSEMSFAGTVGRYVASGCPELTKLTIAGKEVPFGIAANDAKLAEVQFVDRITIVKQEAFLNCTSLKSLDLGPILSILEADAFQGSSIEQLTVAAANPAGMAQGVFTEQNANITVKVPVDYVAAYKAAAGWCYLNIVGDANVAAGPSDMGMPAGLYYAGTDGKLHCSYADGESDVYEVGGVPHTFQLIEFKDRIYGASAGQKFVYSATGSVDGDGKLFYISQIGGELFQAVVLDNAGGNAYKDPFGLYIYGETLFVNDRNVCIRQISADAIALPSSYPSWVENNWLGFYGQEWTYGCIKSGWAITTGKDGEGKDVPVYWVGMKYAGNGIYRFRDEHVGTSELAGAKPEDGVFLNTLTPIFTTFYVDETHNHIYIYIEKAGGQSNLIKGGLYRLDLDKLEANHEPKTLEEVGGILVDGSPVKYEGSSTNEHVGISQLSPSADGKYLYWCYRAPTAAEAAANEAQDFAAMNQGKYWWADKYDENSPLHKSGIKRIALGEANPVVEMVVPGVEGYGCVPVNYEGSKKPDAVIDIVAPAAKAPVAVVGGELVAVEDAEVVIYSTSGLMVASTQLKAGEAFGLSDLAKGAYVAVANGIAVKFVK